MNRAQATSVEDFVSRLLDTLPQPADRVATAATSQLRSARTILRGCGRGRGSASFWEELSDALRDAGLYVDRDITQPGLRGVERFRFSRIPFDDPGLTFTREASLARFVEQAIGKTSGPFAGLEPIPRIRTSEYRLPSGRRIDILCRERGTGTLVAIELKSGPPDRGVVTQLDQYLREVRRANTGKEARGIIVSGPSRSEQAEQLVRNAREAAIDWYFYSVAFESASDWFSGSAVVALHQSRSKSDSARGSRPER